MKASNVVFRRQAQEDIDIIAHYIAGDNQEAAERFLAALDDLCELLMHTPDIGSARIFQSPLLLGLRVLSLKKFEKYLIFYRLHDDEIEIIRVIHGARNYPSFFSE